VKVDVVVKTKSGLVMGLTKDDFILKDKGKAQKIDLFAGTPGHNPDLKAQPLNSSIATNRQNWRGEPVMTATIILLDRLNTPTASQAFTRKQVLDVLASLKENDSIAFLSLYRDLTVVHDFTADPGPLIRSARRLAAGSSSPAPAEDKAVEERLTQALNTTQSLDQTVRPGITDSAFRTIANHLAGLPGKKNLIWVTQSAPLSFGNDVNRRSATATELNSVAAGLQESNVAIYTVSPGGVGSGFNDTATRTDRPAEGTLMPGANAATTAIDGALSDYSTLQTVATSTGGQAFANLNDVRPVIRALLDDSEMVYTLTFHPDSKTLDDRMHDLNVDLAKGKVSGSELHFRKRYLAAKNGGQPAPSLAQLASASLESTAIALMSAAQPDPAQPGERKVDVNVQASDLALVKEGDHWLAGLELALVVDAAGTPKSVVKTFHLNLTEDQHEQVMKTGFLIGASIPVQSAQDIIRVIVREPSTGAAGSVRVRAGE
jgi:VWFA-related protein